ncbi:major tail protein [Clostridium botulinum]|uniref:major tail protein n=1 Tax=Clostridium botulinum TaxID=1491 RepID=UPI001C9A3DC1|nr:major tail protein [Clostridium botulinum]MBY6929806.1 phage tail protein [Clostridium botulinum]
MGTKRNKGLKDLYIAKVIRNDENSYTCEAPKKLCKAIKAKIKVKKSNEKLYSDSEMEDSINQFDSCEVELEGDHLTAEMIALLNGATLTNGVLVDNVDDEGSEVALMFRDKRTNGKYEFQCLYCGKFGEEDDDEHETSADKIKTQTKSIKGTFYGRQMDGDYRMRIFEDELVDSSDTNAKGIIEKWFSQVPNQKPTPVSK